MTKYRVGDRLRLQADYEVSVISIVDNRVIVKADNCERSLAFGMGEKQNPNVGITLVKGDIRPGDRVMWIGSIPGEGLVLAQTTSKGYFCVEWDNGALGFYKNNQLERI